MPVILYNYLVSIYCLFIWYLYCVNKNHFFFLLYVLLVSLANFPTSANKFQFLLIYFICLVFSFLCRYVFDMQILWLKNYSKVEWLIRKLAWPKHRLRPHFDEWHKKLLLWLTMGFYDVRPVIWHWIWLLKPERAFFWCLFLQKINGYGRWMFSNDPI